MIGKNSSPKSIVEVASRQCQLKKGRKFEKHIWTTINYNRTIRPANQLARTAVNGRLTSNLPCTQGKKWSHFHPKMHVNLRMLSPIYRGEMGAFFLTNHYPNNLQQWLQHS